jgi:hypothetical protein
MLASRHIHLILLVRNVSGFGPMSDGKVFLPLNPDASTE